MTVSVTPGSRKPGSSTVPACQTFEAIYPGTSQKLAFTGTSAQSAALQSKTSVVMVLATAACFIAVGSNPTAVADTCMYVAPNVPTLIGVTGGQKIAAIQSAGGGNLFITEGA